MDCNFRKDTAQGSSGSPPSEAWLVGQALLGKPIPNPFRAEAEARAERKNLEWLARLLPKYEDELRKLEFAEAEARHERKMLEWMARFSPRHADELRTLLREEAAAREAQKRWERFYEAYTAREAQWNPADHPRAPKGQPDGGRWVDKDGGGGAGSAGSPTNKPDQSGEGGYQTGADGHRVPTDMLELAHAWWQTNSLSQQSRHDIETLPARIASEYAKLNSGDGYSHIHAQNIAKAQRDLAKATELAPQLEKQQRDLEQQYHDLGYDPVPYSTWTPGETIVSGRGIAEVGRAVHMGGSPAGLKPTGIEFDVALTAASVLQLGKALLRKAAAAVPSRVASEPAALKPYGGIGGGHHVPAKSAFEGAAGYNSESALAIPNEELARLGVWHSRVTGAQQTLYREFAKTGTTLTWQDVERIETNALVRGGLDSDVARATVKKAIDVLKKAGISGPTRIPWGKLTR